MWIQILQIAVQALDAKLNNKVFDYGVAALRIYGAAKLAYEQEVGQPIDDSKVPAFVPIPPPVDAP